MLAHVMCIATGIIMNYIYISLLSCCILYNTKHGHGRLWSIYLSLSTKYFNQCTWNYISCSGTVATKIVLGIKFPPTNVYAICYMIMSNNNMIHFLYMWVNFEWYSLQWDRYASDTARTFSLIAWL